MSLSTSLLSLSKDESCGDVGGVLSIIKKCCLVVLSFGNKRMFVGVPALEVNIYPRNVVNVINFINKFTASSEIIKILDRVDSTNDLGLIVPTHFF